MPSHSLKGIPECCLASPHNLYDTTDGTFVHRDEIFAEETKRNVPIFIQRGAHHPQKVVKDIYSCGLDLSKALYTLYQAYPYLMNGDLQNAGDTEPYIIDSRSISAIMDVLKKLENLDTAYNLLENSVQVYHRNKRLFPEYCQARTDECSIRSVYKSFVSLAAHVKRPEWIVYVLISHMPLYAGLSPTVDMMHAVLSSFGKCNRLDLVLEWLTKMENEEIIHAGSIVETPEEMVQGVNSLLSNLSPLSLYSVPAPDRLSYQTASSAFSNVRRGSEAAMILRRMECRGFNPDLRSYNQILAAFSRAGNESNRHLEALKLLSEMEQNPNVSPNDVSYDTVISICMRENAWEDAAELIRRVEGSSASDTCENMSDNFNVDETRMSKYIGGMAEFIKIGSGRDSWYKLGTYEHQAGGLNISFGFQIHRNPSSNGLSFVFFDQNSMGKLGFILVRHIVKENAEMSTKSILYSDLMGMYVDERMRGKGLANIFMALWLKVVVSAEILPRTEIINKPLLSLVLSRFGFVPRHGGFEVIISPVERSSVDDDTNPLFTLYSPTLKHLQSVFGERERRIQRMSVSRTPPVKGGKATFVKTYFDHPWTLYSTSDSIPQSYDEEIQRKKIIDSKESLTELIDQNLPGYTDIICTPNQLRFALFGFKIDA